MKGRERVTNRIFYVGNVFEDSVKRARGITTDSPAASRKVSTLCRSARHAGGHASIISLGRGRSRATWVRYPSSVKRFGEVPVVYLDFWDIPLLTHAVTMVSLCVILLRLARRNSVVVFYNYQAHYVGALILARLLNLRCILDLEDGRWTDAKSLRGRFSDMLLKLHNTLCTGGAMLACRGLKDQVTSARTYVCYGVAESVETRKAWTDSPLQVLLGGSLLEETGAGLFLDTLSLLLRQSPDTLTSLAFVVTGFGDLAAALERASLGDFKHCLSFRGSVTSGEYSAIIRRSHVGLCLKLPSSPMGATTFPSKVVELASHGLLVVSTRVSDVPVLFDSSTAILLDEANAECLASALTGIARSPEKARMIASAGHARVGSLLAAERVGAELLRFWNGSAANQNCPSVGLPS